MRYTYIHKNIKRIRIIGSALMSHTTLKWLLTGDLKCKTLYKN